MLKTLRQIASIGIATEPAPQADESLRIRDALQDRIREVLGRALCIRHVDAGSCNGCELEIHALNNPLYNLEGLGIRFVASPRHADLLHGHRPCVEAYGGRLAPNVRGHTRPQACGRARRLRLHRRNLRGKLRELRACFERHPCRCRGAWLPASSNADPAGHPHGYFAVRHNDGRHRCALVSHEPSLVAKSEFMAPGKQRLLEIPNPFPVPDSRVLLLEPADGCAPELCKRLLEGTYDKPFILDHGALRYLHFDINRVESLMYCGDPDGLCLRYTRKMMAFLLFNPAPHRILLLGLGGGSLAKFCYRRLPSSTITVVESDPTVMALREEFRVPSDDERFHVLQADGVRYVAGRGPRKDVILVDAYDRHGIAPPELATAQFYHEVRRRLSLGGVLVVNLFGDAYERVSHITAICNVFGKRVIVLPAHKDGNLIVLAFPTDAAVRDWERLEHLAHTLKGRLGLNFPRYLRKMIRFAVTPTCAPT